VNLYGVALVSALALGSGSAISNVTVDSVGAGMIAYGAASAPVKVIVFVSPGCTDSLTAFKRTILPALERDYIGSGRVRLTVMITPLDDREVDFSTALLCSPAGPQSTLDWQLRNGFAANANGYGWAVSNAPKSFSLQDAEQCALRLGYAKILLETRAIAERVFGVTSTPTFIVGGKSLSNPSYRNLQEAIDAEIKSPTPPSVSFDPRMVSASQARAFYDESRTRGVISGKTLSWLNDAGNVVDNVFEADGVFRSSVRRPLGGPQGRVVQGTWQIRRNGSVCVARESGETCYYLFDEDSRRKISAGRTGRARDLVQ
jgi:protein-disulfide isomerase